MASVTIYDVAARAGVSIKTVSRVMNAGPNVSEPTRERVLEAAEALGYHPNLSARSLAGSRSFLIAVFVDAALTVDHWKSERGTDYLSRIQLGATVECRAAGYHLLVELVDHDAPQVRQEVRSLLAALKPDGVILTPPSSDNEAVLELLQKSATPFVRLGPEGERGGGLRVRMQDHAAALGMTEHLIGLGHRRIGFVVGEPRYGASQARRSGYLEAMAKHGLPVADAWIRQGDFTFQSGIEAAKALLALPEPPTAIFASNDDMALGCLSAAAEAGIAVPDALSIAGFDGSAGAYFSRPQLTTVRQPLTAMASHAARALITGAVGPHCDEDAPAELLPPFELIVRQSTAAAPSRLARGAA
jgi:LacI family transcriptional regulator